MKTADETILENLKKIKEYCEQNACTGCIYNDKDNRCIIGNFPQNWELDKVKEEQQDIDIQAIEEISISSYKGFVETCRYIETKGNELIKAIKQLDRNIRKEK